MGQSNSVVDTTTSVYSYHSSKRTTHIGVVKDFELHDAARSKIIPIRIYYPKVIEENSKTLPVVIFSHGWLASKDDYSEIGENFARNGFVCIHPTHSDSLLRELGDSFKDPATGKVNPLKAPIIHEFLDHFSPSTLIANYRKKLFSHIVNPTAWMNRAKDLSFVIDSLPVVENIIPQLRGRLQMDNVAVVGHSMGAYAASLLGGTEIYVQEEFNPTDLPTSFPDIASHTTRSQPPLSTHVMDAHPPDQTPESRAGDPAHHKHLEMIFDAKSFRDNRVKCIACLAPQGTGVLGLRATSWSNIQCPMLIISGGRDTIWGKPGEWTHEAFDIETPSDILPQEQQSNAGDSKAPSNSPPPKVLIFMHEADHSLGGIFNSFYAKLVGYNVDEKQVEMVKMATVAFCDANMRGHKPAQDYIYTDDKLEKYCREQFPNLPPLLKRKHC